MTHSLEPELFEVLKKSTSELLHAYLPSMQELLGFSLPVYLRYPGDEPPGMIVYDHPYRLDNEANGKKYGPTVAAMLKLDSWNDDPTFLNGSYTFIPSSSDTFSRWVKVNWFSDYFLR